MKTIRPNQDPDYKKPTITTKTGVATILFNNFIPHSKLFSETEGFLIEGASFLEIKFSDPPVLKPHTQASLPFLFHRAPHSFSLPFERGELSRYTKRSNVN